ncbi:MAG: glycosyltransferase family 4 protein [Flavobacteriales bacterium]
MARVALNGRLLVPGKLEGIGRFTQRCLEELVARRPHDEFLLLVDQPIHPSHRLGANVEVRRMVVPGRRPWLLRLWFGLVMTWTLKRWRADALVSLEGPLAMGMPASFPQLSVIHDLNFVHHPGWLPRRWARYYNRWFPAFARRANVLGTVSECSRQDLSDTYGINRDRVVVIPNAADESFVPLAPESKADAQQTYAGGSAYFVYVGSLHPRKNIGGLLAAFESYRAAGGTHALVVVGASMWGGMQEVLSTEAAPHVHWAGRLNDESLAQAMGGAECLLFLPWFEGFGIPLLEAMACGVPVIASNVTSIPEVCGGAAFALHDPTDIEGVAASMKAIDEDYKAKRAAIERGLVRASEFGWARSGALLDAAVDSLLELPQEP